MSNGEEEGGGVDEVYENKSIPCQEESHAAQTAQDDDDDDPQQRKKEILTIFRNIDPGLLALLASLAEGSSLLQLIQQAAADQQKMLVDLTEPQHRSETFPDHLIFHTINCARTV